MKYLYGVVLTCLITQITYPAEGLRKGFFDKVSSITKWAKQKKENAQRLFFCLTNPTQCDAKEVRTARTWLVGSSIAIITAIAAVIGITLTAKKVQEMKEENAARLAQETVALAQNLLYRRIGEVYTILENFSSKLETTPTFVSREVENYEKFTTTISKPEVEQFKKLVQEMQQLGQQTLEATQGQLEEGCRRRGPNQEFLCEVYKKLKAINKFNAELEGFSSTLDQYYRQR
jgi:hypothetical protein